MTVRCESTYLLWLPLSFMLHPQHCYVSFTRACVKGDDDVSMQTLFQKLLLIGSRVDDSARW